jgi:hypothetical protein
MYSALKGALAIQNEKKRREIVGKIVMLSIILMMNVYRESEMRKKR